MKKRIRDLFNSHNISKVEIEYVRPELDRCCYFMDFYNKEQRHRIIGEYYPTDGENGKLCMLTRIEHDILDIIAGY